MHMVAAPRSDTYKSRQDEESSIFLTCLLYNLVLSLRPNRVLSLTRPFVCMFPDCQVAIIYPETDIRDAHDAHVVLEAVRLGVLPLIKRRLLSNERDELHSGYVYVWEEAQDDGGLLRWTDGRRWYYSP